MRMPEVAATQDDTLTFPLKGKDGTVRDYSLQPCSIDEWEKVSRLGLSVVEVMAGRTGTTIPAEVDKLVEGMSRDDVWSLVIGADTFTAMRSDGVSIKDCQRVFASACLWYATGMDDDVVAAAWSGKAQKTPSAKGGGGASKTPTASTSGTSTRKATNRRAAASRGKKSGPTAT